MTPAKSIVIRLRYLNNIPFLAHCMIYLHRLDETPYLAFYTSEINLDNTPRLTFASLDTPTRLASARTNNIASIT